MQYHAAPWMPTPSEPPVEFNDVPISILEFQTVVKTARSTSAPVPFHQIPYQVFQLWLSSLGDPFGRSNADDKEGASPFGIPQ